MAGLPTRKQSPMDIAVDEAWSVIFGAGTDPISLLNFLLWLLFCGDRLQKTLSLRGFKSGQVSGLFFIGYKGRYISSWEPHLRATGHHLPYGITQCYLPPDTNERAPPNPSHAGWYSIYLPRRPEG